MTIISNILGVAALGIWVFHGTWVFKLFPSPISFVVGFTTLITIYALIRQKRTALIVSFIGSLLPIMLLPLLPIPFTGTIISYFIILAVLLFSLRT